MEKAGLINKSQNEKKSLIKADGKSSFVREKNKSDKKIGYGGFGDVVEQSIVFNGRELKFAKKISTKNKEGVFTTEEIKRQMDIYKRLKGGGLKTFTTFRTDGEAFYSTFLNKDGVIALSGNNMPPSKAEQDIDYKELLAHKIEINNLDEIIEQIIEQAILASKVGVTLSYDSLFFLVPENNITVPVDIDFIIGDFDIVTANDVKKNRSAYDSLGNLEVCIKKFLAKYAKKEKETDYYFKVSEKLNPKLEDNQLFVKDGIKNIGDYSSEDGEVLKSNYIDFDVGRSWDDVEKILKIPGIEIILERQEYQEKITNVEGSLSVGDGEFYDNLNKVGGNLQFAFAEDITLDTLSVVGGKISFFGGAKSFIAPKLKIIGNNLVADNVQCLVVPSLQEVEKIVLTKAIFINDNKEINWETLEQEKKLVIPEKLRKKIIWR